MSFKSIRQCVATVVLAFAGSLTAFANQSVIVDCKQGGQPVVTSGLTSTTKVLQSFPSCTITVNIHGGGLATLFSDNVGTPLGNPFTAQNNPYLGAGFFYAANGRVDVTISGGGLAAPITFSDIILNDPASLLGCSQIPVLTGDVTTAGGTCATVLPNIASAGTGLKTTINAKGQATGVTTAASTDLSDTAVIARLNAAANFGANPVTTGALVSTTGTFSGSISGTGATFTSEVAPSVTGVPLGDAAHRWDMFVRNLDISSAPTFSGGITANGITDTSTLTVAGSINKVTVTPPATGSTLTLADGKTLTVNNTLTLAGTDGTTLTGPASIPTGGVLSFGIPKVQVFTVSGTFTIPTGVTAVKVTVIAGGGGGGGGTAVSAAGGGSGSGVGIKWLSGLTPGNTLTVVVGTGGTGGVGSGAAAGAGVNSSVSSGTQIITSIIVNGGLGGGSAGSFPSSDGAAAGTGGDLNFGGNPGGTRLFSNSGGDGAPGPIWGGGGMQGDNGNNGFAGKAPGAGGGAGGGSVGNTTGGAGAAGIVIFEWMN